MVRKHSRRSAGFSLIELLVALVVVVVFFLAIMALIESSARINKVETGVSNAQQSARYSSYQLAHDVRMARVGGLGYDAGIIPIYNNTPAGQTVTDSGLGGRAHPIRQGTDAFEVRGVIQAPLFALDGLAASLNPPTGTDSVTIKALTTTLSYNNPAANSCFSKDGSGSCQAGPDNFKDFLQRLHTLDSAFDTATGGTASSSFCIPFVVVDSLGIYDVGTLTTVTVSESSPPVVGDTLVLTINFADSCGKSYNKGGGAAVALNAPSTIGLLDDFLYFVHDGAECSEGGAGCTAPLPDSNKWAPFLARARRLVPLGGAASGAVFDVEPLAESIEDMQVAYGIDGYAGAVLPLSSASLGPDGLVYPKENANANGIVQVDGDEWFPNVASDTLSVPKTSGGSTQLTTANFTSSPSSFVQYFQYQPPGVPAPPVVALLRAVKIAVVAVGDQPDPNHKFSGPGSVGFALMDSTAKPIGIINPGPSQFIQPYHRRVIDLAVNLRNYGS
jgi:prepilin-type N-terminal cleavage/methylation domain-containing protein